MEYKALKEKLYNNHEAIIAKLQGGKTTMVWNSVASLIGASSKDEQKKQKLLDIFKLLNIKKTGENYSNEDIKQIFDLIKVNISIEQEEYFDKDKTADKITKISGYIEELFDNDEEINTYNEAINSDENWQYSFVILLLLSALALPLLLIANFFITSVIIASIMKVLAAASFAIFICSLKYINDYYEKLEELIENKNRYCNNRFNDLTTQHSIKSDYIDQIKQIYQKYCDNNLSQEELDESILNLQISYYVDYILTFLRHNAEQNKAYKSNLDKFEGIIKTGKFNGKADSQSYNLYYSNSSLIHYSISLAGKFIEKAASTVISEAARAIGGEFAGEATKAVFSDLFRGSGKLILHKCYRIYSKSGQKQSDEVIKEIIPVGDFYYGYIENQNKSKLYCSKVRPIINKEGKLHWEKMIFEQEEKSKSDIQTAGKYCTLSELDIKPLRKSWVENEEIQRSNSAHNLFATV